MAETNSLRQFLILLYKGLLLRKRHYIITFFEFVIPVLMACIPLLIQIIIVSLKAGAANRNVTDGLEPEARAVTWDNYITYQPFDPFKSVAGDKNDMEFVYTPDNDLTKQFIDEAVKLFKNRTGSGKNITTQGFKNEKDLESYWLFKQRDVRSLIMIGTVFNNLDGKDLPPSLDYKIRYGNESSKSLFATNLKYRIDGPQKQDAYTSTYFLSWQTAVEETFISQKMLKGKKLDYKVWMQRFPYPEHRSKASDFPMFNLIPWFICIGYLIYIINLLLTIIEEKVNGTKELLKMMGMTDCVYWSSTFVNYFVVAFFTTLIITIVYKIPWRLDFVFMKNTDFFLLFILILLFMASLTLFSMVFTVFFNKAVFALIAHLIVYNFSISMLSQLFLADTMTVEKYSPLQLGAKLGICLLPTGSLHTVFMFVSFLEKSGDGANWSNITDFSVDSDLNLLMVMGMMLASCLLYIFIIWYFDKVWPWQNGVPRPFYFPFTREYWCGAKVRTKSDKPESISDGTELSSDFFEEDPTGATPGVVIKHLFKSFRTGLQRKLAVNNVSLNIYNGQITALLGHNGAGKTTTINILTGLYTPTSGSALINGIDIVTDTVKARRGLGVCPQHNVLFDTLTVEEHLRIYAAMKGVPWKQLTGEVVNVLTLLRLVVKKSELVKNLSGGMKRKLCLGIAIIGGSNVLFLDEPTSGIDVEARRSVWDALLELRRDRTVILTTHYMEEADILGDRIAIMAEGEVQCCGSPMFLKRKFGTGYHLHIVKDDNFDLDRVTNLLNNHIPGSTLENELEKEITFNLTSNTAASFGEMFEDLEQQKSDLGVSSCGITITTMEDVFLNVANISDLKYKIQKQNQDENGSINEFEDIYGESREMKSDRSHFNQFYGLMVKRFHYARRNWSILITHLALPLILMFTLFSMISDIGDLFKTSYDPLKLDLPSVYGKTDGIFTLKNSQAQQVSYSYRRVTEGNKVSLKNVSDPTRYILEDGKRDISHYLKKFLVGGAFDILPGGTQNLTAWFNGEPYHATPMTLLLMHTAVLRYVDGDQGQIVLTNEPLPRAESYNKDDLMRMGEKSRIIIFVPLAFGFMAASFVMLPIHERVSKSKLMQLMTGIPAAMYWLSMFLWDFFVYALVSLLLIIPFAVSGNYAFFGQHSEAIGTALLLMLLYGWASIPFSYLISFPFQKPNYGFSAVIVVTLLIGNVAPYVLLILQLTMGATAADTINIVAWILRIFPPFALADGFSQLFGIAYKNAVCESLPKKDLETNCKSGLKPWQTLYKCCPDLCGNQCLKQTYPITWDTQACGRDIFFLALDGAIYFGLVLLLETAFMAAFARILKRQCMRIRKRMVGQIAQDNIPDDTDVMQEKERIRILLATSNSTGDQHALMVDRLTKVFRNYYAVDHLTFGIRKEECFGLLGVNGAGKTTTFRMLTGDCYPDDGDSLIQDTRLRTDLKKFQSFLGYCPQFDALIDRLTGREMLTLFGRLRGLKGKELGDRIKKLITMTDLSAHADKQTQFYSGGNKRKLSVALALIGSPPLILLDEPTAGVDPVSRRKIWNILAQARNNTKAAILLTSHSMEESEALCSRLAIMVNGRFRCLGSIQQLKSKYGQGYTLIIKLKRETFGNYDLIKEVKSHIEINLPGSQLKDDHQGMVQYHVVDPSVTLSRLFKFMADMKARFDLEDYLISDTSLEQIFLTFARAQRVI